MRLFQNILIIHKSCFFFELEAISYIRMGLSLAKQVMLRQKMFTIPIFGSPVCTPLILYHQNG